ncbi:unnamed protein product, partial [Acidithrix sp. C25]
VSTTSRRPSMRMDLRTTPDERRLIDRAVQECSSDLVNFVISQACEAAQRVLADRDSFVLDGEVLEEWNRINAGPTRDLLGLCQVPQRPSSFVE